MQSTKKDKIIGYLGVLKNSTETSLHKIPLIQYVHGKFDFLKTIFKQVFACLFKGKYHFFKFISI